MLDQILLFSIVTFWRYRRSVWPSCARLHNITATLILILVKPLHLPLAVFEPLSQQGDSLTLHRGGANFDVVLDLFACWL